MVGGKTIQTDAYHATESFSSLEHNEKTWACMQLLLRPQPSALTAAAAAIEAPDTFRHVSLRRQLWVSFNINLNCWFFLRTLQGARAKMGKMF